MDSSSEVPNPSPVDSEGFRPPERFSMVDYFLERNIREGGGGRTALLTDTGPWTYQDVSDRANRYGNVLREAGVEPEQRVLVALPDGPDFVAAFFGALKIGAVVVMVNPHLRPDGIDYVYRYTRATAALVHSSTKGPFLDAAGGDAGRHLKTLFVLGDGGGNGEGDGEKGAELEEEVARASEELEPFPSHRDDPAVWLFSGGTTGRPKAVVQPHASFANTTECYAKQVIGYTGDDVTLSVPKLYFGYATGSNLLFPFAAGGATALFSERATPEVLFQKIREFRPTILVNVPTMVRQMVEAAREVGPDLSSLRLATSAGEALPVELHRRWKETFGVELLDGLGTAEMWHIFLSNRPGAVRPGTLGRAVPGFEVRVCDADGTSLPDGRVGELWVRGNSRAIQYWQRMERTKEAFRGEWYVSGDMVSRDEDGYFTYHGRGDDMLKVKGKWLAPGEVENRLLEHPSVREAAVVGVSTAEGLTEAHAFVIPVEAGAEEDGAAGPGRDRSPGPAKGGNPGPAEGGSPGPAERGSPGPAEGGSPGPAKGRTPGPAKGGTVGSGDPSEPLPSSRPELEEELRSFLRERLESYKVPAAVVFTESFPRTHLGKVDRGALRKSREESKGGDDG